MKLGPPRGSGRGAPRLAGWLVCVLVGVLLMLLAVALDVDRGTHRHTGAAIPVVNIGRLPTESGASGKSRLRPRRVPVQLGSHARLRLARLGVAAPIKRVTVVGNVMRIPRDPDTVGWWTGGSAPGDPRGSVVVVGHVNYAGNAGALAVLPGARPGDSVVVVDAHRRWRYEVVAIRSYPKAAGLPVDLFSHTGPPRLVLITCGGPFDRGTGNYEDNIVAYAEPA